MAAALAALRLIEENPDWASQLQAKVASFQSTLAQHGVSTPTPSSHIIPVLLGEPDKVMEVATHLRSSGILVGAIRPPTVPPHTARLRLSLSLGHEDAALARAATLIGETCRATGKPS